MSTHQNSDSECDNQSHSYTNLQPNLPYLNTQSLVSLTSETHHQNQPFHSVPNYQCLTTIKGHASYISSITLGEKFFYTGSSNKEIRTWKRQPSSQFSDLEIEIISNSMVAEGEGVVKSLIVSSDKLFSAHQDNKIRVWKINNQEPDNQQNLIHLATLPTLNDRASKLLSPKNQVQVHRHKTSTWVHHVDTVSALALSLDESLLYSVSWDRTLKIWRTRDFKCLESIANAHDDAINTVVSSADGNVYTGSTDKKIKLWRKNTATNKHSLLATLEKHVFGVNALALSSDGSVLFSGSCDRSIIVWEKGHEENDPVMVGVLKGHTKSILCIFVIADIICSGSADKTIRVWRCSDRVYSCLAVLKGHQGPVKCLTAAVDSQIVSGTSYLLYSGSLDCDIKVWQVQIPFV